MNYGLSDAKGGGQIEARHRNTTLAQNIDNRIADMEEQVARLKKVKQLLSEPAGLLNVPIDDLRFAMNY